MIKKWKEDKIDEWPKNQIYFLDVIANLNERVTATEEKNNDSKIYDLKDVLDSETIGDEFLVNNSNDIISMKKNTQEMMTQYRI